MASNEEIKLVIKGDSKQAVDELKKVNTELGKTGKAVTSSAGGLSELKEKWAGVATAMIAAYAILKPFYNALKGMDQGIAGFNKLLESTGYAAGMSGEAIAELASSLEAATLFEKSAIFEAEKLLLTFTSIGKDVFPRATEAILDMSTVLGQDVKSSALQLGKALNDPIEGVNALRRVGVQLSTEQEGLIKNFMRLGDVASAQKVILKELETEFGGVSKAIANTFTGQIQRFFMDLEDLPKDFMKPLLGEIQNVDTGLKSWSETLSGIASGMGKIVAYVIQYVQQSEILRETLSAIGNLSIIGLAVKSAKGVSSGIKTATEAYEKSPPGESDYLGKETFNRWFGGKKTKTKEEEAEIQALFDEQKKAEEQKVLQGGIKGQQAASTRAMNSKAFGGDAAAAQKEAEASRRVWDEYQIYVQDKDQQAVIQEQAKHDKILEGLKAHKATLFNTEAEYQAALEAADKEHKDRMAEQENMAVSQTIQQYTGMAQQIVGQMQQTFNAYYAMQYGQMDQEYKKKRENIIKNVKDETEQKKQLDALDKEYQGKKEEVQRKQAEQQKALSLAAAIMSVAQAIATALAVKPPGAGIVLASIIGAMGAAQIAMIASTPAYPAAAEGGLIMGSPGGQLIRAGENSASEAIIPLENDAAMEKLSGAIGGNTVVIQIENLWGDDDAVVKRLANSIDAELYRMKQDKRSRAFS